MGTYKYFLCHCLALIYSLVLKYSNFYHFTIYSLSFGLTPCLPHPIQTLNWYLKLLDGTDRILYLTPD
jgi:hypothetical protein